MIMNNVNVKYDYLLSIKDDLENKTTKELDDILRRNDIHRFFYKSVYENKIIEGIDSIINSLRDIVINTYLSNYDRSGLLGLGIDDSKVTEMLDEYKLEVESKLLLLRDEYYDEIKELRYALEERYNEVRVDNTDLRYDEVARFVDWSYTAKHDYKVCIPSIHVIYTSYFYYFIINKEGYIFSKSKLRGIEVGLKIYRKNKVRKIFSVLSYIVGVNAARDITHVSKGIDIDLPDKCTKYSTKVNSRINKELKKYVYKNYYNLIKDYYVNKVYDSPIDYKYLRKYGYEI